MKNSWVQWVPKEWAIVLPYLFNSDLQYNLRQGWRHAFSGYCDHCSWKKLNSLLQCPSSLRCCSQSVHVYQNCLEQSEKHVCNGTYDHYIYMETRLKSAEAEQRSKKTDMVQWLLAVMQRVKHCIGTKNRSLSRQDVFKIQICKHHKM